MVSAPPLIAWEYNHEIKDGSPEAQLVEVLKNPRDWIA
jgi:coproporphyrinogen III oxidase